MGICVHCMQPKEITVNKCHHCHERTPFFENLMWNAFYYTMYLITVVGCVMLFLWLIS
jgi:hypothetical protein